MNRKKQKRASRNVSRRANIEKLKAGPDIWNPWSDALREQDPDWRADLRDANLAKLEFNPRDKTYPWSVDLRRAILSGANLRGADLRRCDLRAAKFRGADLQGANLDGVDVRGANFDKANLNDASLINTKLQSAKFVETRVDGACFANARIGNTYFVNVKLDGASGLEEVNHYGPSHLSIGTLTQSGGKLPKSFVHACGVHPLVQTMLGGTRTERELAFDKLHANGFQIEIPQRYILHLFHGWRAIKIHRYLNEHTDFGWHLFNLQKVANEPSALDKALQRMKKNSTVIVLYNSQRDYVPRSVARTIFKRLEKIRRRRRLKVLLLCVPWRKHHLCGQVRHHRIIIKIGSSDGEWLSKEVTRRRA